MVRIGAQRFTEAQVNQRNAITPAIDVNDPDVQAFQALWQRAGPQLQRAQGLRRDAAQTDAHEYGSFLVVQGRNFALTQIRESDNTVSIPRGDIPNGAQAVLQWHCHARTTNNPGQRPEAVAKPSEGDQRASEGEDFPTVVITPNSGALDADASYHYKRGGFKLLQEYQDNQGRHRIWLCTWKTRVKINNEQYNELYVPGDFQEHWRRVL